MQKLILSLFLLMFVSACSSSGKNVLSTVVEDTDTQGNILKRTYSMSSADYVKQKSVAAAEAARTQCFKSSAISELAETAQVAAIVAQATGNGVDCGAGFNDALIAQEKRKTDQTKSRWNFAGKAIKFIAGAYVGGEVVDVLSGALTSGGTTITAQEGSTVELDGAVGQGNTASRTNDGVTLDESDPAGLTAGDAIQEAPSQ